MSHSWPSPSAGSPLSVSCFARAGSGLFSLVQWSVKIIVPGHRMSQGAADDEDDPLSEGLKTKAGSASEPQIRMGIALLSDQPVGMQ